MGYNLSLRNCACCSSVCVPCLKHICNRYSMYEVAMAHHVIAVWFIRCRIQYRPSIVKFVNKVCAEALSSCKFSLSLSLYPPHLSYSNSETDARRHKRSSSFTSSTSPTQVPTFERLQITLLFDFTITIVSSKVSDPG